MNYTDGDLPSVAGRMEMTHGDFQRACRVALRDIQEQPNPDTSLLRLLCEAVRCSQECCELARSAYGSRVFRGYHAGRIKETT